MIPQSSIRGIAISSSSRLAVSRSTVLLACIRIFVQAALPHPRVRAACQLRGIKLFTGYHVSCYRLPMQPYTPVDYTGTGAAVTLASVLGVNQCKWFQVVGTSITGVPGRVGDAGVSLDVVSPLVLGRGFPIASGGGQFSPPIAFATDSYDLAQWYIVLTTGDTASVGCAI